jgi:hypothetical protein
MSTPALTSTDGATRVAPRIHPGHLSVVATALGLLALGLTHGHDPCLNYAAKSLANGLIVTALGVQVFSLLYAVALCLTRAPRALSGLAASALLTVLAVPAAFIAALAVNGFLCG